MGYVGIIWDIISHWWKNQMEKILEKEMKAGIGSK